MTVPDRAGVLRSIRNGLRHLSEHPAWQVLAGILIILVLIFFGIQTVYKASRAEGNDFISYLSASQLLLQGESPYRAELYFPARYPLFLPLMVTPLLALPLAAASSVWYLLAVAALLLSIRLLFDWLAPSFSVASQRSYLLPAFCVILIFIPILQNNAMNGQINPIVLLLCLLFFHFYQRKNKIAAVICLATASALKIVPLLFLLFLLLRREYRMAVYTSLLFLFLCLLPLAIVGMDIFAMYADFMMDSLYPYLFKGLLDHTHSLYFSLYGFLATLLPGLSGNVLAEWLSILLIVTLLICVEYRTRPDVVREPWIVTLYLLAILLITPISETHHLLLMLPSFSLLVFHLIYAPRSEREYYLLGIFLFVLIFYAGHFMKYNPFFFLALVVLWVTNIGLLLRLESQQAEIQPVHTSPMALKHEDQPSSP